MTKNYKSETQHNDTHHRPSARVATPTQGVALNPRHSLRNIYESRHAVRAGIKYCALVFLNQLSLLNYIKSASPCFK